jgi:hypothetical protein
MGLTLVERASIRDPLSTIKHSCLRIPKMRHGIKQTFSASPATQQAGR